MRFTTVPWRTSSARGFTLIELLVVVAVVGVVAAIATPGLLRSRISANEASAIASLRVIASAQQDFAAAMNGFADTLATLADACPGDSVPFVSPDLGDNGVEKSGYRFTVVAGEEAVEGPKDCFGNVTQTGYYATAAPAAINGTGNRGFATNDASAIWQDTSGAVPEEPFEVSDTTSPLGRR